MKKIEFKEMQCIQLNILSIFHEVCKKYNLRYSLTYGTLLGAIRHKGFIPWDDDIDIMMPREDYNRLLSISNEIFKIYDLQMLDFNTDGDYIHTIGKLIDKRTILKEKINEDWCPSLGVYIDIFPLDYLNQDEATNEKLIRSSYRLNILRSLCCIKIDSLKLDSKIKYIFIKFLKKLLKIIGPRYFIKKQYKLLENRNNVSETDIKNLAIPELKSDILQIEDFNNLIETEFEKQRFFIIKNYNEFLTIFYGDYMKLPSVEEQIPSHNVDVYWK